MSAAGPVPATGSPRIARDTVISRIGYIVVFKEVKYLIQLKILWLIRRVCLPPRKVRIVNAVAIPHIRPTSVERFRMAGLFYYISIDDVSCREEHGNVTTCANNVNVDSLCRGNDDVIFIHPIRVDGISLQ